VNKYINSCDTCQRCKPARSLITRTTVHPAQDSIRLTAHLGLGMARLARGLGHANAKILFNFCEYCLHLHRRVADAPSQLCRPNASKPGLKPGLRAFLHPKPGPSPLQARYLGRAGLWALSPAQHITNYSLCTDSELYSTGTKEHRASDIYTT
jgi:hypothetical protein